MMFILLYIFKTQSLVPSGEQDLTRGVGDYGLRATSGPKKRITQIMLRFLLHVFELVL